MKLSIVIACCNDNNELIQTIASIHETAGSQAEIVVVSDFPDTPLQGIAGPSVKVVDNLIRCGCGPSRHIGAMAASGDYLLLIDSHMRFLPGWYESAMRRIEGRPRTIHCATCLAIDSNHMNPLEPVAEYHGATLNVYGPDLAAKGKMQCLEVVWLPPPGPEDDAEIPAVMGAGYFVPRDWFLRLGALRYLKTWGGDELMLSVKCWLAGGDVRLLRGVRIAHKFLTKGERQMWVCPPGHVILNKLLAIHTLLPRHFHEGMRKRLAGMLPIGEWEMVLKLEREFGHIWETERAYNRSLFRRDFLWLMKQFGLPLP